MGLCYLMIKTHDTCSCWVGLGGRPTVFFILLVHKVGSRQLSALLACVGLTMSVAHAVVKLRT